MRDSAEYRAAALQTYRAASTSVAAAAGGHKPGSWAVVLDADETVISNLQYQIERAQARLPYTPESWRAWVARREATPLPGAAAFLGARPRSRRTHRDRHQPAGIGVPRYRGRLQDASPGYDVMLCRPDGGPSDKNPRFASVAAGTTKAGGPPLDVLVFVGDNILDFPGLTQAVAKSNDAALAPFGTKFFMVPNPMYGSWQQ